MTRRCSHCSNNGHNSRTCPARGGGSCGGGGVKLFGVRLTDGSNIKKSASTSNLASHLLSSPSSPSSFDHHLHRDPDGYLSDDPAQGTCASNRRGERKKGVPWTEEEHRLFLIGLQKLGKGDWRGIARNYVTSRTPTQVASHAQKYFIRQTTASRRKRRSSLFDMAPDMAADHPDSMPSLDLSLASESKPMETSSHETVKGVAKTAMASDLFPFTIPGYFPTHYEQVPLSMWPSNISSEENKTAEICRHQVLKPIPLLPKEPVNVDELVGLSQLTLLETENGSKDYPALSLNLLGEPLRQSAFHANAPVASPDLSKSKNNPIQAV
ncbi:transcription factor MYBS3 [Rhodamnia argentea]|uniref:Transcription factor MYBS3 n=1 Tax=Rhodamnia argentea TaxID=178133 RepID=A0A8B8NVB2_9MYRT|nr:transcription factor MYBS3 [Rhodamnia argentea]